jgi:hypothetical protein
MSENENPISPLLKKPILKLGQKPKEVWNFFITFGEKKEGHQGCKCKYCPWTQTRAQVECMVSNRLPISHQSGINQIADWQLISPI